ncbi:MAG: PAS domain S-box protein, partial [Chloroflexi bacterium]|nr:PAS domain S-box protein [Chloroflexota bacterium]
MPRGIQARLFGLIALSMLPFLVLLGSIYFQRYQNRRDQALQTEVEVARGVATTFAAYVQGVQQQNFAVGQAILADTPFELDEVTHLLDVTAGHVPAVRNMSWLDVQGRVQASSLTDMVGRDLSIRDFVQAVLAGKPWAVGDLIDRGVVTDAPTLGIATAIRDDTGQLRGVVISAIEPTRLSELTFTQERSASGIYALVDRQGVLIYSSAEPDPGWDARVNWMEGDPVLSHVLSSGQEQYGIIPGEENLGSWMSAGVPVNEIGFVAVSRLPVAVALQPVLQNLSQNILITLLVWLLAFLLAYLLAQTIARPLYQFEQDANAIGSAEYRSQVDALAPKEVLRLRLKVEQMANDLYRRAEALRESEARFRALFHNRHSPMLLIDPESAGIVDANPAASEYYGWSHAELLQKKISDINLLPAEVTYAEMKQARDSESSQQFYFRHHLASGEVRDVEVRSGPIQWGGKEYL